MIDIQHSGTRGRAKRPIALHVRRIRCEGTDEEPTVTAGIIGADFADNLTQLPPTAAGILSAMIDTNRDILEGRCFPLVGRVPVPTIRELKEGIETRPLLAASPRAQGNGGLAQSPGVKV